MKTTNMFFERMKDLFTRSRRAKNLTGVRDKAGLSFSESFLRGFDFQSFKTKISDPYREHPWVYACLNTIARKISSVPFTVASRKKDARGNRTELENSPAFEILKNPNPHLAPSELWQATALYLHLRGEALWLMEFAGENPSEIWLADPERATPIVSPEGELLGWTVRGKDEKEIPFSVDEVVRFRFFNPANSLRGLSPLEPARSAYEQDYKASKHNEAILENFAVPGGIIKIPSVLTESEFARLKHTWAEGHKGTRNAGRIGWLMGGMEFQSLGLNMKDLDFISGRRFNREEVLAVFGTPPAEVQVYEYANYANAQAQGRKFWHNTLIPILIHFEEVLEAQFFRKFFPDAVGYFDLTNVEDLEDNLDLKSQIAERFFRMGFPPADINERLELGFDAEGKPWLSEGWLSQGLRPARNFEFLSAREKYFLRGEALSALVSAWGDCVKEKKADVFKNALLKTSLKDKTEVIASALDAAERALRLGETIEQAKERVREIFKS